MTNRDRVAFACYLVPALTLLTFGIRYLTASEFMPYHAAALGREWSDLLPNEKGFMLPYECAEPNWLERIEEIRRLKKEGKPVGVM